MIGYKAFNGDGTNRYGKKFEINEKYHEDGEILARFGNTGRGYYYCTRLADVFRFFDDKEEIKVGVIEASGTIDHCIDEYYDYEIFACSDIKLLKYLNRKEILNLLLLEGHSSIDKAIRTYKFNDEEKDVILDNVRGDFQLIKSVLWYCYDKKDIFTMDKLDSFKVINKEYARLDEKKKALKIKM